MLAALGFAGMAVASEWRDLGSRSAELPVGLVALAALCGAVALGFSFLAWSRTLAGVGASLPASAAMPVFFIGQLGKYLPGTVWTFLAQMELGHAAKVRRERTAAAGVLVLLIGLSTALLLGVLAIPALIDGGRAYLLVLFLLGPLGVLLRPSRLDWLIAAVLRRLRRPPLDHPLSHRTLAEVAVLTTINNLLLGLAIWCLALQYGDGVGLLPLAIGGYSLAAAVGLLAVPLPAGAGAREAVLVLVLAPAVDDGAALLIAIVSRVLLILTDLAGAALAAAVRRRSLTAH